MNVQANSTVRNGTISRMSRMFDEKPAPKDNDALKEARAKFAAGKATLAKAVFDRPATETAHLFEAKTLELFKTKAFEKIGTQDRFVDVVKDVINLLPIHWLSQEVVSISSSSYLYIYILC